MVWGTDAEHSHDMPWLSRKVPTPTSEASKLFLCHPCAPKDRVISHDKYCISSEMQPSTPGEKKRANCHQTRKERGKADKFVSCHFEFLATLLSVQFLLT